MHNFRSSPLRFPNFFLNREPKPQNLLHVQPPKYLSETFTHSNVVQWPRLRLHPDQYAHPVSILSNSFLLFWTCQLMSGLATQRFFKWIAKIIKNLCEHLLGIVTSYLFKREAKGSPYWGKQNRWLEASDLTFLDNCMVYVNQRISYFFFSQ